MDRGKMYFVKFIWKEKVNSRLNEGRIKKRSSLSSLESFMLKWYLKRNRQGKIIATRLLDKNKNIFKLKYSNV
jgi:hypothetical protein